MIRRAILQVADTGPLESLVVMLRTVGIECYIPSDALKQRLRAAGCDTVLDIKNLVSGMGYDNPFAIPEAGPDMMLADDVLYVDVKAHRNGPRAWKVWPGLERRTLWYRINGGMPEHVINKNGDHGDEVNPPCPVITPNRWYNEFADHLSTSGTVITIKDHPWAPLILSGRAYSFWPPFYRFDDYPTERIHDWRLPRSYGAPICLVHGIEGWGYRDLIEPMRELGVRCHGVGAPDGLVNHREVPTLLSRVLAMVHLKSNDAPGYALYEALAAACPVICTRRIIWRCRMQDLLIPDETCLVFDRETHDSLTKDDVAACVAEVSGHLDALRNADVNRRIGEAGRAKLKQVMWSADKPNDVGSLAAFVERNFGK